ncbi:MAG: acyl-CoA synthetase [Alphaproteobacteria bacterium]|nr:acyl-CoA synthetase [Alphaproteobacteria bacterium]
MAQKKQVRKVPQGAKPPGKLKVTLGLLILGPPLFFFFLPTWVFLFLSMLPSVVAFVVDRTPYRYAWVSVAGLNLAGVAPYLMKLWFEGHSMSTALKMLSNPFDLIVMVGAAGLGWVLHLSLPPVVGAWLDVTSQRRLTQLRATQRKLLDEWGAEVAQPDSEEAPVSRRR